MDMTTAWNRTLLLLLLSVGLVPVFVPVVSVSASSIPPPRVDYSLCTVSELATPPIIPLTESVTAIQLAIAAVNNDSEHFPNITFTTRVFNLLQSSPLGATVQATQEATNKGKPCIGIIGPPRSSQLLAPALYSTYIRVPLISPFATAPAHVDKKANGIPYTLRTATPDTLTIVAFTAFLASQGWKNVAIIVSTSPGAHVDNSKFFIGICSSYGISVRRQEFYFGVSDPLPIVEAYAHITSNIVSSGARVVIPFIPALEYQYLYQACLAYQIYNNPNYVIMGLSADITYPVWNGSFLVTTVPSVATPAYSSLAATWAAVTSSAPNATYWDNGDGVPSPFALTSYDTVLFYAHACQSLVSRNLSCNDGDALLSALKTTSFMGTWGYVAFDQNGDLVGTAKIVNIIQGIRVPVATYTSNQTAPHGGSITTQPQLMVYQGGSTIKPSDGHLPDPMLSSMTQSHINKNNNTNNPIDITVTLKNSFSTVLVLTNMSIELSMMNVQLIEQTTGTLYSTQPIMSVNSMRQLVITMASLPHSGVYLLSVSISGVPISNSPQTFDFGIHLIPFTISLSYQIAVYVITAITTSIILCTMGVTFIYRQTAVIKTSSAPFCMLILFFLCLLSLGSIFQALQPSLPSSVICNLRAWFLGLGMIGVIAPLVAKANRIRMIFTGKLKKDHHTSNEYLWKVVIAMLLMECVLLAVYSGITDIEQAKRVIGSGSTNGMLVDVCSSPHDSTAYLIWFVIQMLYVGVFLIVGLAVAWSVRKVPHGFNDSAHIVNCQIILLSWGGIIVLLNFIIDNNPNALLIIRGLGQCVGTLLLTMAIFGPKILRIAEGRADERQDLFQTSYLGSGRDSDKPPTPGMSKKTSHMEKTRRRSSELTHTTTRASQPQSSQHLSPQKTVLDSVRSIVAKYVSQPPSSTTCSDPSLSAGFLELQRLLATLDVDQPTASPTGAPHSLQAIHRHSESLSFIGAAMQRSSITANHQQATFINTPNPSSPVQQLKADSNITTLKEHTHQHSDDGTTNSTMELTGRKASHNFI